MGELQKFIANAKRAATQSTNPFSGQTAAAVADAAATNRRLTGKGLGVDMLAYPMDTADFAQGHYVIFQLHSLTNGKLVKTDAPGGRNRSFALKGSSKKVGTQIALYMPPQVSVSYKNRYADTAISSTAENLGNIAEKVASGQYASAGKDVVKSAGAAVVKGVGSAVGAGVNAAAAGLKELAFVQSGKIVTDKMELVFEGVERRSFTFEFTFIPKSPEEANQVFMIVNAFKIAMLPKYTDSFGAAFSALGIGGTTPGAGAGGTGDEGRDRTLTIPTTMDIKYYMQQRNGTAKENGYLNKISTCYLKDLDIKYGGDRYTAYEEDFRGASPQSTSITMLFNEIEIITKEAALQGY
jgi:hypothetical protein